MNSNKIYMSHGRSALKFGLQCLNLRADDNIFIPDYICDIIPQVLQDLDIHYSFYSLKNDLTPDWKSINEQLTPKTKAILMVHYFGFPQNIYDFQKFCNRHNLLLIEDNAHGYGGRVNGCLLGEFGDIGVNSPRKSLGLISGGQLLLNDKKNELDKIIKSLPIFKVSTFKRSVHKSLGQNYFIKSWLRFLLKKQPKYWDPFAFKEDMISDYRVDSYSEKILKEINIEQVVEKRRALYLVWEKFAIRKGVKPVFSNLYDGASPLVFPAYVKSLDIRKEWFDWGWENRYNVHSWPTLPELVIQENRPGFTQWSKLICFPIDLSMDADLLEKKLSKL